MKHYVYTIVILVLFFAVGVLTAQKSTLQWKAELKEDVKKIQPIQNGKYIFLWADEYAWLYNNTTGKKTWSIEIDDYNENAIHQVVNDSLYLTANEDSLLCYNMVDNELLWKKRYQAIQQKRFSGSKLVDSIFILSFKEIDLGIDINTGSELWRTQLEYQQSLVENGTVNSIILEKMQKYFAFTDNDDCQLISTVTGKKLLSIPKSEPNGDLVKQKRAWYYVSADEKYIVIMFDKNMTAIDIEANKIIAQRQVAISDKYNIFLPTTMGCALFGEEKLVHVNFSTGVVAETTIDIDDVRNVVVAKTDSVAVLVLSQENNLLGLNLDNGKLLWQTAPKFQPATGFIHRYIATDANNIMVSYLDPSDDVKLYIMSIDVLTGKINYRTFVAHSDESLPDRLLPLPALSQVTETQPVSFGFDDAGFTYSISIENEFLKVLIHTSSEMIEPNTKRDGGEGIVFVDLKSGSIMGKTYMKIAGGISFPGKLAALAPAKRIDDIILLPGNKNLVALSASTGSLKWMHIEQDLKGSYIFEMSMIDSILYLRTGGFKQEFSYDAKKEKLTDKKLWEDEGYAILAVDTADGKIYWRKDFESDPGRIFHDYSAANYSSDHQIFAGDEKFLYSISTTKKGMLDWKFEFSDSGVGSLAYDDIFRKSVTWTGERPMNMDPSEFKNDELIALKQSVAVGETLKTIVSKVLHVNYSKQTNQLIVIGDDGIASVNVQNGRRSWYYEWDYDEKEIYHRPVMLKNNIFYYVSGTAVLLNADSGKVVWQSKLDKENSLFVMPDHSSIIAIDKDEITGFVIP
ncbi:MAG: PQQ-binding-like beta-propeller repeat protein [Bacteroidota bacterium]